MTNVKTAISIQKSLFDQVEALAREMKVSRSRLFVLAVEEFVRRRQNEQLLQEINRAYAGSPPASEQVQLRRMRRQHKRLVEGEW